MVRFRIAQRKVEQVGSALGITRISQTTASQVLHATETDVNILRSSLQSWNVPKFRSFPLLLRALTHPSISNWVERTLHLPKRSLGPNTLELLGDCVIGTCVARHILSWVKDQDSAPNIDWKGGPRAMLHSLVGNRGMAVTARNIGIEQLMRWEKSIPPASHRPRLDEKGIDIATGIQSNVEINALAAAYEATSAAIYLDGGFFPVSQFVLSTLLTDPSTVQKKNRESTDYEQKLFSEIVSLFGEPVALLKRGPGNSARKTSYERVQVEILDMQQNPSQDINRAHALFFAGVAIRRVSSSRTPQKIFNSQIETTRQSIILEDELVTLTSHFSVETARIAALTQALALLRGVPTVKEFMPSKLDEDTMHIRSMVPCEITQSTPMLTVKFGEDGRWQFDGDYKHIGNVLKRAGLTGFAQVGTTETEVRKHLQEMWSKRVKDEEESYGNYVPALHSSKTSRHDRSTTFGALPRRDKVNASLAVNVTGDSLKTGAQVQRESELHRSHPKLADGIVCAEEVVNALDSTVDWATELERPVRVRVLNAYQSLGHQATRLWAAQRSIHEVSQDRSKTIPDFEAKMSIANVAGGFMIGSEGLSAIRDGGLRKSYVAVGMCVERFGTSTALAWLTGVEHKCHT